MSSSSSSSLLLLKVEKYYKKGVDVSNSYKISGKEATISLKKELKENGAKYNPHLLGGPGWIVGKTRYQKTFKTWLSSLKDHIYTVTFDDDKKDDKNNDSSPSGLYVTLSSLCENEETKKVKKVVANLRYVGKTDIEDLGKHDFTLGFERWLNLNDQKFWTVGDTINVTSFQNKPEKEVKYIDFGE